MHACMPPQPDLGQPPSQQQAAAGGEQEAQHKYSTASETNHRYRLAGLIVVHTVIT